MALPYMIELSEHGCIMQDKVTIPDGEGGVVTTYKDGAPFKCYPDLDTSSIAQIAEAQGSKAAYTINVPKSVNIEVGKIFKISKSSDDGGSCLPVGAYFRVTSDPTQTPNISTLALKSFKAEKTEFPG